MKKILSFLILGLLATHAAKAGDMTSPFDMHQQYSADVVIHTEDAMKMFEVYFDNGKARLERNDEGKLTATIVRPDQQKFYYLNMNTKAALDLPYAADQFRNQIFVITGAPGNYQLVGPETTEGIACLKYKGTGAVDKKAYTAWVDATTKAPVKIVADDATFGMVWKNYKPGPQTAALFELPPDFKVISPPGQGTAGGAPGAAK
jgi:hypothetical protein